MKYLATLAFVLATTACAGPPGTDHDDADDAALMEQAHEENLLEGKADGTDCSGVRVPDRNGFNKKIALTFDDGPNPATTPKIIEVLKKHHAPAAFFNNGMKYTSQAAKDLAASIAADDQFILANHSQRHLDLAHQSATTVASEMDRTTDAQRELGNDPKYFRFPFGSSSCATMQQAKDRNFFVVGWHIDSADWCYAAGNGYCKKSTFKYVPDSLRDDLLGYVMSQARQLNGGIILMHDIHGNTANHLDAILTALEADGFSFVRLDDEATFPRLHGHPAGWTPPPPTEPTPTDPTEPTDPDPTPDPMN